MKNFYAYIIKNREGKILNTNFHVGQVDPPILMEKDEAYGATIKDFIEHTFEDVRDAELTIAWYIKTCDLNEETPEKLHVEKVQITIVITYKII